MNRRQKLVQQQFLNNEEEVIKRLKSIYAKALKDITGKISVMDSSIDELQKVLDSLGEDELGELATAYFGSKSKKLTAAEAEKTLQSQIQSKVYQKNYQQALKKQVGGILDKMHTEEYLTVSDYLDKCYEDGFIGTMFDLHGQGIPLVFPLDQEAMVRAVQLDSKISKGLYNRLGEDVSALKKKITAQVSRGIATGMSYQQVAKQLANQTRIGYNNAIRIARTEGHRVQVQSSMDACYKAKERGADVVKEWNSALDARTRDSHVAVHGQIRELDEKFSNGLMFPGDPSGPAAEVINCRCALNERAKWALSKSELKSLQDDVDRFGFDASDNLAAFKEKYNQANSTKEIEKQIAELLGMDAWKVSLGPISTEAQEDVLKGVKTVLDEFPLFKGHLNALSFDDSIDSVAVSNSQLKTIKIGPVYLDYDRLKKAYANAIAKKWSPVGTNPASIVIHEFGHQLDGILSKAGIYGGNINRRSSERMMEEVLRRTGVSKMLWNKRQEYFKQGVYGKELDELVNKHRAEWIKNNLSEQALKNNEEFFAECFSEYLSSETPRATASAFWNILMEAMEGLT